MKNDGTDARKFESFAKLLDDIDGLDDNRKRLFKEVYENAVSDRDRAVKLFDDLSQHIDTDKTNKDASHTLHGQTLVRYLERMHRSTEQLLRLSELIAESLVKKDADDFANAFDQISNEKSR